MVHHDISPHWWKLAHGLLITQSRQIMCADFGVNWAWVRTFPIPLLHPCVILKQLILLVNPILFFASCTFRPLEYSTFTKSNPPPKEFLSKTQSYSPKWVLAVTANAAPGRRVPVIASAHHAVYVPTSPFPLLLRATCSHEQASDLARVPCYSSNLHNLFLNLSCKIGSREIPSR